MQKFLMKAAIGLAGALMFTGCQSISQVLSDLPPAPTLANKPPAVSVPAQSAATAKMEAQVLQQINAIRVKQGLGQLRPNEKLAQVARNYSRRMAEQNYFFSHTGPGGDTMAQRVQSAGIFYVTVGENLFTCTNVPQPVPASIKGWMNSPGHRENILRAQYQETGIGVWRRGDTYYFTQLFLRSLSL